MIAETVTGIVLGTGGRLSAQADVAPAMAKAIKRKYLIVQLLKRA
jgi:hypothetical protein